MMNRIEKKINLIKQDYLNNLIRLREDSNTTIIDSIEQFEHILIKNKGTLENCIIKNINEIDYSNAINKIDSDFGINFNNVLFDTFIEFKGILTDTLNFKKCFFKSAVDFKFLDYNDYESLFFDTVYFASNANFESILFRSYYEYPNEHKFKKCYFGNDLQFNKCKFEDGIIFENCIFRSIVIMNDSTFEYHVMFNNNIFDTYIKITKTIFEGHVDFIKNEFSRKMLKMQFSSSFFTYFKDKVIQDGRLFSFYELYGYEQRSKSLTYFNNNIENRKRLRKGTVFEKIKRLVETIWIYIKHYLSLSNLYHIFSNYGNSILRPFLTIIFITLSSFFLFNFCNLVEIRFSDSSWDVLYKSFILSIKGIIKPLYNFKDINPINGKGIILYIVNTFLQIVMLGFIVVAIRRKFRAK